MSITSDMDHTLTALARVRAALAMDPSCRSHAEALHACALVLEECLERIGVMERGAVGAQHGDIAAEDMASGRVVPLAQARRQRAIAAAKAVRL